APAWAEPAIPRAPRRRHGPRRLAARRAVQPPTAVCRVGFGHLLPPFLLALVRLLRRGRFALLELGWRADRGCVLHRSELAADGADASGQPVPRPTPLAGHVRARVRAGHIGRRFPGFPHDGPDPGPALNATGRSLYSEIRVDLREENTMP